MATSWKSQQGDGKYYLQFETDDKEKYRLVEKVAQMTVDETPTADVAEVQTEPEPMKNIMVVYRCVGKQGDIGIGRCSTKTDAKLPLSIDSIKQIEEDLEKDLHYKNVILLNYFLLGDE